jgi:Fe-S cluster assembly ATP-binding protein
LRGAWARGGGVFPLSMPPRQPYISAMLKIENLSVTVREGDSDKPILTGLSLDIPAGEIHALMGPNGAGKSTLSYVLTGREGFKIVSGAAQLDGVEVFGLDPEARAALGLFLSFQYPVEIPGVPVMTFVRTAMNSQRKARGEPEISAPDFIKRSREVAKLLNFDPEMLKRAVNVGFSGGEKKRLEIYQMMMLEPRFMVLDETDSGLDIDALRTVAEGVNALRAPERGMLVITHYQRLLDYIKPDKVHVLAQGRIIKTGGPELAHRLEKEGYDGVLAEVV